MNLIYTFCRKQFQTTVLLIFTGCLNAQSFKLFEPVPAQKSGITFKNIITENEQHNALTHENLYNGGGVGIGDINNDGLDDIFFISNMGYNKLYLNLGNFKFKDITESAGVGGREGWKTGVTMVDINGDNLLDIYVCYSGKGSPEERRNELFINKGNMTFEEKARSYGLDDPTYSTIGAFFDFDLDGDLDLFLLATNVRVIRGMEFEQARTGSDLYAGDKLFRNDGDHFTDITGTSGILSNGLGYGLGVAISDINKDGLPDIYVTNDYIEPDYLYINNGNGTFTNRLTEYVQHISQSAMGCEINDFNNDGDIDLFTGGRFMPGEYPVPQNSYLLVNDGKGHFKNMTASLLPEMINAGMITDAAWTDLNKDNWPDLITAGEFMPIRVFINDKGKKFTEATSSWFDIPEKGFWNRIEVADFNKDGNMDIVAGNFGTNSQLKASVSEPVELTFRDFDNYGTVDPILTYYLQGRSYPFATRDELIKQISGLGRKFPNYESYATAKLTDLFSPLEIKTATVLSANELRTVIFINNGTKFEKHLLPVEAQFAPVYAIEILDYNQDENPDFILAGNNSAVCVRLGVMDGNYGQLFEGDGKGNFSYIHQDVSGLSITGDVKSLRMITVNRNRYLLAGINNRGIVTYKISR